MTQQEFQELTGLEVSPEQFGDIHDAYMSIPDGKHDFCQMWKNATEESRRVMILLTRSIKGGDNTINNINAKNKALLDAMFESVHRFSDPELRNVCIEHMGKREYLLKMLDKGYRFWDDDKEMLRNILE